MAEQKDHRLVVCCYTNAGHVLITPTGTLQMWRQVAGHSTVLERPVYTECTEAEGRSLRPYCWTVAAGGAEFAGPGK